MSEKRCDHFDCVYYSPTTNTCDYMIIVGTPRGCKATADCEKYCTDASKVQPLYLACQPRNINFKQIRKMEAGFMPGDTPSILSARTGVPESQTYLWMRKTHPECMRPSEVIEW